MNIILFYNHNDPFYELSNFYPFLTGGKKCDKTFSITYKGEKWPTSEHLYQALKFKWKTPEEIEWKEHIRTANTPTIAKYLGHQFTHRRWKWQHKYHDLVMQYKDIIRYSGDIKNDDFRYKIMKKVCKKKFAQNEHVRDVLCETGTAILGENCSSYWGFKGENALGNVLMKLRDKYNNI